MTPMEPWQTLDDDDFDPELDELRELIAQDEAEEAFWREWDRPTWEDVEAQVGEDYWLWADNWRYGRGA